MKKLLGYIKISNGEMKSWFFHVNIYIIFIDYRAKMVLRDVLIKSL